jgi:hypothetical protein
MRIIHDRRLPEAYLRELGNLFPESGLIPFWGVEGAGYDSISCHPDIFLFQPEENTFICSPGIDGDLIRELRGSGIRMYEGEGVPGDRYPHTVRYNAVTAGGKLICHRRGTDPRVLGEMERRGYGLVDVKQGYCRCSVMKVSGNSLVTYDTGVARRCEEAGLDVLTISPGSVELPGHSTGLIGGAAGYCPGGMVCVLGDLDRHPDGRRIREFVREHGSKMFELKGLDLFDAGGLFFV